MRKKFYLFFLIIIAALSTVLLFCWISLNEIPAGGDSQRHILITIRLALLIQDQPFALEDFFRILPAKHGPLTYILGASFLRLMDFSPLGIQLTQLIFWLIILFCIIGIAYEYCGDTFLILVPALCFLSIPAFWQLGMTFDLDLGLVAGVSICIFLLLHTNRLNSGYALIAGTLLVALFGLSKSIILIHVIPIGAILIASEKGSIRWKRVSLLLAVFFSAGTWLISHRNSAPSEMTRIIQGIDGQEIKSILYYFRLILIDYRGIAIIMLLCPSIYFRFKSKDLMWHDLAFLLTILIPFTFYSFLAIKHSWYLLACYLTLPIWTVFSLRRLWDRKGIRKAALAVTVLFSLVAILHGVVVLFSIFGWSCSSFFSIAAAKPPSAAERFFVKIVSEEFHNHPNNIIAIDLMTSGVSADRFIADVSLKNPETVLGNQITACDEIEEYRSILKKSLKEATVFYFARKVHEVNDCTFPAEYFDAADSFIYQQELLLQDGLSLCCYMNRLPELTKVYKWQASYEYLTEKIYRLKTERKWREAYLTIQDLRRISKSDQRNGIDLEEAYVLAELGLSSKARKLAQANIDRTSKDSPLFSESALLTARLYAEEKQFDLAEQYVRLAASGTYNANIFAVVAISIAEKLEKSDQQSQANEFLSNVLNELNGEPYALLSIEMGKQLWMVGQYDAATEFFTKALNAAENIGTKKWLIDTLEEIARIEPTQISF